MKDSLLSLIIISGLSFILGIVLGGVVIVNSINEDLTIYCGDKCKSRAISLNLATYDKKLNFMWISEDLIKIGNE